jgi:DNA-binding transcriptional LysR family regulator
MVAGGIGCTLLPKLAAMPGVGSLQSDMIAIRPLAAPTPCRTIGIVWRQHYPRESTVRALAELLLAQLPSLTEDALPERDSSERTRPPRAKARPSYPSAAALSNM